MEIPLVKKLEIVLKALLDGRTTTLKVSEAFYKTGMSSDYSILFKMKKYTGMEEREETVWVDAHMQVSLFIKLVEELPVAEIRRLMIENMSLEKRNNNVTK